MDMKLALAILMLFVATVVRAANPSFQAFDTNFFSPVPTTTPTNILLRTDTNTYYLSETLPVIGYAPAETATLAVTGPYIHSTGLDWTNTVGNVLRYTNDVIPQWVLIESAGGLLIFRHTNSVVVGTWFPTSAWTGDYGLPSQTRLIGSLTALNPASLAISSYFARRGYAPTVGSYKGAVPTWDIILGFPGDGSTNELIQAVNYLRALGVAGIVDSIHLDQPTPPGRNASGAFTNLPYALGYTNWSYAAEVNYVETNGFAAGIWMGPFAFDPTTPFLRNGSQGYYHNDSTNYMSAGYKYVLIDCFGANELGLYAFEDNLVELIEELRAAAVSARHPVKIFVAAATAYSGSWSNVFALADTWTTGPDNQGLQDFLSVVNQSQMYIGYGKYPMWGVVSNSLTSTTNGMRQVTTLLATTPANVETGTNAFNAATYQIVTNTPWRTAWKDAACAPGYQVMSNAALYALARPMANGDVLVGIVNLTGSAVTTNISYAQIGYYTNINLTATELHDGTNVTGTVGFSTTIRANDAVLFRVSPVLFSGSTAVIYTGVTNIGSAATSLLISIGHTMPNTNYFPDFNLVGTVSVAGTAYNFSGLTTTNFTVNLSGALGADTGARWSVLYSP